MSGPITVVIVAEPIAALLSAAAIRAAHAIREGYEQAAELREEHAALQEAQRATQSAARLQGAQALEEEVAAAEAKFDQLIALSEKLGAAGRVRATRPVRPAMGDPLALAAYARGLHALAGDLQAILLTEAARQREALEPEEPGIAVPATASREAAPHPSERFLSRIAHL